MSILDRLRAARASITEWNTQAALAEVGETWTVTYTAPRWSTWATGPVEDLDGARYVAEYAITPSLRWMTHSPHALTPGARPGPDQWHPSTVAHLRTLIGQHVTCLWTDPAYPWCTFGATGVVMRPVGHRDQLRSQLGADIGDGRCGQFIPPTADVLHVEFLTPHLNRRHAACAAR